MSKSTSKAIPPLLKPLLHPTTLKKNSLLVLTGVLGATTNWLVLRYLYAQLSAPATQEDAPDEDESASVVLVSFMRDGAFWREGASKLVANENKKGLDLDSLRQRRRFAFVDGLSGLFVSPPKNSSDRILTSPDLSYVMTNIIQALDHDVDASPRKVLIIDQIDVLVATTGLASEAMQSALLSLREVLLPLFHFHSSKSMSSRTAMHILQRVDATVLTLAADDPLIHTQTTRLEREHASLVLSHAHAARTVVALRRLDSGPAPDVSGVMRISSRRRHPFDGDNDAPLPPDAEYLYHVAADGSVTVFERGAK
ncbi:hypothetical protein CP533_6270 [Ophiocordyceps camponoti-saundersi (nom. inval.)]|nr:hypothetical protein CP533_6270 [Ophiocordyceps camponoti-saundersi (nom. inval.)]